MIKNISRLVALSLIMGTGLGPIPSGASAQEARPVVPVRIPADAVRIACCRCLDGSKQSIAINTRTAPWKVAVPGSSTFQPATAASNSAWAPVAPAGWVAAGQASSVGDYSYQLQFYVPPCVIPAQVVISGRFAADNGAKVYVDQQFIKASQGTPNYGFLPGSVTPFTATVTTPGLHTLRVVVTNSGGVTGMIMQASIATACPKELEKGIVRTEASQVDGIGAVETQH